MNFSINWDAPVQIVQVITIILIMFYLFYISNYYVLH